MINLSAVAAGTETKPKRKTRTPQKDQPKRKRSKPPPLHDPDKTGKPDTERKGEPCPDTGCPGSR